MSSAFSYDFSDGTLAVGFDYGRQYGPPGTEVLRRTDRVRVFSGIADKQPTSAANWSGANLAWSAGQKVRLSIGTACAPGVPTSLGATPSAGQLALSWTAPTATGGSAITGYDVHYTGSATVDDGAPAFPFGSDPATGWVNANHERHDGLGLAHGPRCR